MSEPTGNRRVVKLSNLSAAQTPDQTEEKDLQMAEETVAEQKPEAEALEKAEEVVVPSPDEVPEADDEAKKEASMALEALMASMSEEPKIEDKHESLADALHAMQKESERKQAEEEKVISEQVSDEVGIIAAGTKILGDIVTDGHLEINGVVQGSINARGNVRVNGDVYGDIACGNLIIKEGVLKINVQAREDISLGQKARIEGDIKCRKIGIEGTIVGNVTATELVQVSDTASVNGNITTGGISVGMGAYINGAIKTIRQ